MLKIYNISAQAVIMRAASTGLTSLNGFCDQTGVSLSASDIVNSGPRRLTGASYDLGLRRASTESVFFSKSVTYAPVHLPDC